TAIMEQAVHAGLFAAQTDPHDAAETYISLLLGEIPMRHALGRLEPLCVADCTTRAERAFSLTCRLYASADSA
ncbi:MAG: hypothetical protein ACK5LJ_12425, partial [Paracoccus sp. (in: a-proteobacteria)]